MKSCDTTQQSKRKTRLADITLPSLFPSFFAQSAFFTKGTQADPVLFLGHDFLLAVCLCSLSALLFFLVLGKKREKVLRELAIAKMRVLAKRLDRI